MTVRYSKRALAQLDEILTRLGEESPQIGIAAATRFDSLASMLARRPAIGRPTDLKEVRVFRASPYPYLLFYRVDQSGAVTILRIRHTARGSDWRSGS